MVRLYPHKSGAQTEYPGRRAADFEADHPEVHHAGTLARVFKFEARIFQILSLYEQRLTRNIHKNMKLLLQLQDRRKAEQSLASRESKPLAKAAGASQAEQNRPFIHLSASECILVNLRLL